VPARKLEGTRSGIFSFPGIETKNGNPESTVWVEKSSEGCNTWAKTLIDKGGTALSLFGAEAYFWRSRHLSVGNDDTRYPAHHEFGLTNGAP
jgi:hypothetical protein